MLSMRRIEMIAAAQTIAGLRLLVQREAALK